MKIIVLEGQPRTATYDLVDPSLASEAEFEHTVVQVLHVAYPAYQCILFGGTFSHEDAGARRPDLALVARDFSHWFVIEVELTSHSLEYHVLPQVRAFVYGEPQEDCAGVLARNLMIDKGRAETLVRFVPRSVAVVANRSADGWASSLRGLNAQLLVVSAFRSPDGGRAVGVEGELRVVRESLGFGSYSAVDRSIRFQASMRLPRGPVQFVDDRGIPSFWGVVAEAEAVWATRATGTPEIDDGSVVQVVRTLDGRLLLRSRHCGRRRG